MLRLLTSRQSVELHASVGRNIRSSAQLAPGPPQTLKCRSSSSCSQVLRCQGPAKHMFCQASSTMLLMSHDCNAAAACCHRTSCSRHT